MPNIVYLKMSLLEKYNKRLIEFKTQRDSKIHLWEIKLTKIIPNQLGKDS